MYVALFVLLLASVVGAALLQGEHLAVKSAQQRLAAHLADDSVGVGEAQLQAAVAGQLAAAVDAAHAAGVTPTAPPLTLPSPSSVSCGAASCDYTIANTFALLGDANASTPGANVIAQNVNTGIAEDRVAVLMTVTVLRNGSDVLAVKPVPLVVRTYPVEPFASVVGANDPVSDFAVNAGGQTGTHFAGCIPGASASCDAAADPAQSGMPSATTIGGVLLCQDGGDGGCRAQGLSSRSVDAFTPEPLSLPANPTALDR